MDKPLLPKTEIMIHGHITVTKKKCGILNRVLGGMPIVDFPT